MVTVAGAVKGIITDRDLLACLAQGHDPYLCKITTHMQRPVHVLRPDEDHATAADVMRARRIKRLPIAQNGKLLGIVSLSDLAAIAGAEAERLRTALRFFTAVVRTQASQNEPPREASLACRSVSAPAYIGQAAFMRQPRAIPRRDADRAAPHRACATDRESSRSRVGSG